MIETDRLILRRWRADDAQPHHAMCGDPAVARFLGPPPDISDSQDVIVRQNGLLDSYGSCFFAVERRSDGRFIGWCGIKPGPEDTPIANEPEIGWSLARHAWGEGYAREAAAACLADAWGRGLRRVAAITAQDNARSRGLMERLGMIRCPDEDFDHPALAAGDPLRRHIVYRLHRPHGL